jgi:hypothetical protein
MDYETQFEENINQENKKTSGPAWGKQNPEATKRSNRVFILPHTCTPMSIGRFPHFYGRIYLMAGFLNKTAPE